jgi:glutamine amidotransferase PdxT
MKKSVTRKVSRETTKIEKRINKIAPGIKVLAENNGGILACEQKNKTGYYLAACFHPELASTVFHEHFLKQL